MKIKTDFVTNSSSTMYIISINKENYRRFSGMIRRYNNMEDASNEGVRIYYKFETVKQLTSYCNGNNKLDWVQECTGPNYDNMEKEAYDLCVNHLRNNKNKILVYYAVDYNVCESFDGELGQKFPEHEILVDYN